MTCPPAPSTLPPTPPRARGGLATQSDDERAPAPAAGAGTPRAPPPPAPHVAAAPLVGPVARPRLAVAPPPPSGKPPAAYLVLHNVSKKHNAGTLARVASAFGVEEIILVGRRQFMAYGAHGAADHVVFRAVASVDAARDYLHARGAALVGVEIDDAALAVGTNPWTGPVGFLMGNEGTGLSPALIAACDYLVYIPHTGRGTASLNVACAAAVVLHAYAAWAGAPEAEREGGKYVVAPRPQRTAPRGEPTLLPHEVDALRTARAAAKAGDWVDGLEGLALE